MISALPLLEQIIYEKRFFIKCKKAWSKVSEWFATSEYEHACGPELEKGINLGNSEFHYEVWIPIVKKA